MVDDPDIRRAANLMMGRHGTGASSAAAARVAELLLRREIGAARIWQQIVEAIVKLTDEPPN